MLRSPYDYSTRKKRQNEILELIHCILSSRSHVIFKLTRLSYPMNIICRLCIVILEESRNFTAWFLPWRWCNSMFLFLWRLFVTENSGWIVGISKSSPLVPMHRLADLPPEDLRRSLTLIPSVGAANSDKTFIFWWGWIFGRWFLRFSGPWKFSKSTNLETFTSHEEPTSLFLPFWRIHCSGRLRHLARIANVFDVLLMLVRLIFWNVAKFS